MSGSAINNSTTLQVLICTFGEEGIKRIVSANHPQVEGVEYLVSWQLPDGDVDIPEKLSTRSDFKIIKSSTRGLSRNRNIALREASAPLCLIADDDVLYTSDQIKMVMDSFTSNPTADLITFQYESKGDMKHYPSTSFLLSNPPKGYYVTSFEIAFRREKIIEAGIRFNERFGIGAEFMAGEEEIFIHEALNKGLTGIFIPEVIATHDHPTTGIRHANNPDFIRTKGAVFTHTHPKTWPLRMIAHALRERPGISFCKYLSYWINGAIAEIRASHR